MKRTFSKEFKVRACELVIKDGKKHAKACFSLSNNPKFQAKFGVMNFVLTKNVYSLMKALYW